MLMRRSMLFTFVVVRAYLWFWPNADFNVGPYNIHHFFTGTLLLAIAGMAGAVLGAGRLRDLCDVTFGVGLAFTLDEWVYLIVTDGSNAAYWTSASLIGGVAAVTGAWCLLRAAPGIYSPASPGLEVTSDACRRSA